MIHFDAVYNIYRARKTVTGWPDQFALLLDVPKYRPPWIIPSRFGGKINFLGGLPVYFSS